MDEMHNRLGFLVSGHWWAATLKLIWPVLPRFLVPAILLALSNVCAVFSDASLKGGLDLGMIQSGQIDLNKALAVCLGLLFAALMGTILGLVSFSLWLLELTSLSRQLFCSGNKSFQECLKELKSQGKYLSTVWLLGLIYLLAPVMLMSALLSVSLISSSQLVVFGEPLLAVPPDWLLAMNIGAGLLFIITLDYSIILTVLSSTLELKPKIAASLAADILVKHFFEVLILNVFLITLNIGISAPFSLCFAVPQLAPLMKNLPFQVACQFWFAFTSMLTWPLSLLLFAENVKPLVVKMPVTET